MKLDILAFGAHPDDVELSCAGTLAKFISQGKTAGIIDLTQGELGTRGTHITRKQEAENAAKILGISYRENLKLADGFFENSIQNQMILIKHIRKLKPELVFCNALEDRHPDHARAAQLVSQACFLSGLAKIETTDDNGNSQAEWRPKNVLHYIQWKELQPDFVVDITGFEDLKLQSVMAYKTQFYDPDSQAKETPISSQNFLSSITYRMKNLGRLAGVEFAEGFQTEKLLCLTRFEQLL